MTSTFVTATAPEHLPSRPIATGSSVRTRGSCALASIFDNMLPLTSAGPEDGAPIDMFSEPGLRRAEARVAARLG